MLQAVGDSGGHTCCPCRSVTGATKHIERLLVQLGAKQGSTFGEMIRRANKKSQFSKKNKMLLRKLLRIRHSFQRKRRVVSFSASSTTEEHYLSLVRNVEQRLMELIRNNQRKSADTSSKHRFSKPRRTKTKRNSSGGTHGESGKKSKKRRYTGSPRDRSAKRSRSSY